MPELTLPELLRSHRVAARLTQAELAERAGISERAVSDVERGVRTRVYPATAELLADALGLDGAGRAALLVAAKGAPDRALPVDGWRSLRRTPLVGRAHELATLLDAISGDSRLVTVTGAGGIGKSRLTAEACAAVHGAAPEAVAWVGLAGLAESALLVPALAAALGVPGSGDGLLLALARELEGRRALLVLDTFERLLPAAREVAALLDATDGVRVLVTSRAPLRLRGEQELPLAPLPPAAAEELFRQRARAARPELALADDEVAVVCGRLGGVPLAVELAAARVRHLSLHTLGVQLARPLEVLTGGERDLPERHQAMASTIGWSYDLLTPADRAVFRRLGAFAAAWDLQGAERVCGSGPAETLDALGRLCEHGLVKLEEGATQTRWCLRDPIRDYASARLVEEGEDLDTARQHAELYVELAERAAPQLLGADQASARAQLSAEQANLRAALEWATRVGPGDAAAADLAVRLAGSVWMWWRMEGAVEEGRLWLRRVLALPAAETSSSYPLALWGAAWLEYQQGELAGAADLGQRLLEVARTPVDRRNAQTVLGNTALAADRLDDALVRLEEALGLAREGGSAWHLATSLLNLGTARLRSGDAVGAESLVSEALAGHAQTGDDHFRARCLVALGYCALLGDSTPLAAERFAEALQAFLGLDERWGVAECVVAAAVHCAATGRAQDAALLSGAGEQALADLRINLLAPDVALAAPYLATAREALGEDAWQDAQARGRELVLGDAAGRALGALESG